MTNASNSLKADLYPLTLRYAWPNKEIKLVEHDVLSSSTNRIFLFAATQRGAIRYEVCTYLCCLAFRKWKLYLKNEIVLNNRILFIFPARTQRNSIRCNWKKPAVELTFLWNAFLFAICNGVTLILLRQCL